MTAFVCKSCGYRFESEKARKCPYCRDGKIEKEKTAEELVDSFGEN